MPKPCKPFDDCWCETHPSHPNCNTVETPINGGLIYLLLAGVILILLSLKSRK